MCRQEWVHREKNVPKSGDFKNNLYFYRPKNNQFIFSYYEETHHFCLAFCGSIDRAGTTGRHFERDAESNQTKLSGNSYRQGNPQCFNQENQADFDTHFSNKVLSKGITNQRSSGRCWLFTGLNVLRSQMIAKYGLDEMEFSQNYCFFYDQLEKSNLFLQGIIDTREKPMNDKMVECNLLVCRTL